MNKKLKITVGIPTCYGGQSLVETIRSLRASEFNNDFEILIEADRTPWTSEVKKSIKAMGAKSHWNNVEGSQCKKLNQIIKKATGDIFVFTQDDITFDKETLGKIHKAFQEDPQLTMAAIRVSPLRPLTYFEGVMGVMQRVVENISITWNQGNNIYMASGRCLAFRKDFLEKFRINNALINTDTFMYLENIKLKGKFKALTDATVYIRTPQSLKDQVGPSSRYQYSKIELQRYFDFDISYNYSIPPVILLKAAIKEFFSNPINFSAYILVFIYTRLKKQSKNKALRTSWDVDLSTKTGFKA